MIQHPDLVNDIGQQRDAFLTDNPLVKCDDGEFPKAFSTTINVSTMRSVVTVDAVFWIEGETTYVHCDSGRDVISFNFTGCWMSKLRLDGELFAYHINTNNKGYGGCGDCRKTFVEYLEKNESRIQQFTVFNPFCCEELNFTGDNMDGFPEFWGVITREWMCYTLVVYYKLIVAGRPPVKEYVLRSIIEYPKAVLKESDMSQLDSFLSDAKGWVKRRERNLEIIRPTERFRGVEECPCCLLI